MGICLIAKWPDLILTSTEPIRLFDSGDFCFDMILCRKLWLKSNFIQINMFLLTLVVSLARARNMTQNFMSFFLPDLCQVVLLARPGGSSRSSLSPPTPPTSPPSLPSRSSSLLLSPRTIWSTTPRSNMAH